MLLFRQEHSLNSYLHIVLMVSSLRIVMAAIPQLHQTLISLRPTRCQQFSMQAMLYFANALLFQTQIYIAFSTMDIHFNNKKECVGILFLCDITHQIINWNIEIFCDINNVYCLWLHSLFPTIKIIFTHFQIFHQTMD